MEHTQFNEAKQRDQVYEMHSCTGCERLEQGPYDQGASQQRTTGRSFRSHDYFYAIRQCHSQQRNRQLCGASITTSVTGRRRAYCRFQRVGVWLDLVG